MAIQIRERFGSRSGTDSLQNPSSAELLFIVTGSDDDTAIKVALTADAPEIHDLLVRRDISINQLAPQVWEATVTYGDLSSGGGNKPKRQVGTGDISFDTTGGTRHVKVARKQTSYAAPNCTVPDFKSAIGVTPDRKIEGVDIVDPKLTFQETWNHPPTFVGLAYINVLYRLTGTVNAGRFRDFAAGELLFLGATGNRSNNDTWKVTYQFACSPNVEDLVIGDITVESKKGWEYIWIWFEEAADTSAFAVIPRPCGALVAEVYGESDFSELQIGDSPAEIERPEDAKKEVKIVETGRGRILADPEESY